MLIQNSFTHRWKRYGEQFRVLAKGDFKMKTWGAGSQTADDDDLTTLLLVTESQDWMSLMKNLSGFRDYTLIHKIGK